MTYFKSSQAELNIITNVSRTSVTTSIIDLYCAES